MAERMVFANGNKDRTGQIFMQVAAADTGPSDLDLLPA